ncbi:GH12 family glycosyl hydrolase domain-containing protein [Streptomyces hainanensis]|uniref:Glycosyl hydrolase n=1 Tax=Streptomyces hainanensis TaxID=402648 RepID=A0A4R4T761_9ACTN|nr:hypothetical protein E1283_24725 [Streptomyces hainanensis]
MIRAARKLFLNRVITPLIAVLAAFGLTLTTATSAHAATWESSDQWGTWNNGGYILYNNIWGSGAGSQTIWANSYSNWGVWANHPNTGGIKSYPNAKRIVNRPLNQLNSLTSNYNVTVPSSGAYNTTYDIWDTDYDHEVMLWMNWTGPVGPLGTYQTRVTQGGHTWDVYRGSNGANNVYSFLRVGGNSYSGSVNILPILRWIATQGWWPSNEPIGDVQFGYEITSSAGGLNFTTNSFGVSYS